MISQSLDWQQLFANGISLLRGLCTCATAHGENICCRLINVIEQSKLFGKQPDGISNYLAELTLRPDGGLLTQFGPMDLPQEGTVSGVFDDPHQLVKMVDQFIMRRKITHQQYRDLSQLVLADGSIDEHELRQINRLFDAIQTGRVKVLD